MTYLGFHLVFVLPFVLLLAVITWRLALLRAAQVIRIGVVALIAFLYATPWDNLLVRESIWTYGPDRVLGTLGFVPLEEYAFFILQPILTGLWYLLVARNLQPTTLPAIPSRVNWLGAASWLIVAGLGALALLGGESLTYLGLILVWAMPVIAFHWAVGGRQLSALPGKLALAILPPTLYLSAADLFAINAGIWDITTGTSTGITLLGLPVEEFLFFLLTNVMIVQGLVLFDWVVAARPFAGFIARAAIQPGAARLHTPQHVHRSLMRWMIVPSWVLLGGVTLAFLFGLELSPTLQYVPLAISMLLLGLPHGAVDHIVPGRITGKSLPRLQMGALLLGYVLLVGITLVVWFSLPALGFAGFILLTWFHWGLGDLHAALAFTHARFLQGRDLKALTAAVRGALPMLMPLVTFPGEYQLAAESITGAFGIPLGDGLAWAFSADFRLMLGGVLVGAVALSSIASHATARRMGLTPEWAVYTGENTLLLVFFAVVPPFFAIGLYFCLWHSARHIARLVLLDDDAEGAVAHGAVGRALGRFTRQALPMTIMALVLLGGLYLVVPSRPDDLLSLIGLYLALIAGLTVPHALIVTWMDFVQGVWQRPAPDARTTASAPAFTTQ